MSTTSTKILLTHALREAEAFRALFDGCYERWEVAGSVRRQKPDIGDIEHVVIPQFDHSPPDMFGMRIPISRLRIRVGQLMDQRTIKKHIYPDGRTRFGEKYMGFSFSGVQHELWCATPDNFGAIFAMRTGPAEFSRMLVSQMPRHGFKQWNGSLCRVEYVTGNGYCGTNQKCTPVPCPDELTFFKAAGFDRVIPPEERK